MIDRGQEKKRQKDTQGTRKTKQKRQKERERTGEGKEQQMGT